jgi:hypothetical protein
MDIQNMSRKEQLIAVIEGNHEMQQVGQDSQWEACGVQSTERCEVCGLTRNRYRNGQNSPNKDEWSDFRGNQLTLAEAARKSCE